MLYASDLFRLRGKEGIELEENPDDLADLVAEVLAHAVEERQRRQLNLGYQARTWAGYEEELTSSPRNAASFLLAVSSLVDLTKLTTDTARNCFVRAALETISRLVRRLELNIAAENWRAT